MIKQVNLFYRYLVPLPKANHSIIIMVKKKKVLTKQSSQSAHAQTWRHGSFLKFF